MKNTIIKPSKDQMLKMSRAINREINLEASLNFSRHRVHKSAKDYNRKEAKKILWD